MPVGCRGCAPAPYRESTMRIACLVFGMSLAVLVASCAGAGGSAPSVPSAGLRSSTASSVVLAAHRPSPTARATPGRVVRPPPAVAMPDPTLTPGDVIAGVTPAQVCAPGYARTVRFVPASEKIRVYAEYGISSHAYGAYEVDHLVPLELGGSNDIKNLWPQPAVPVPGFHEKDDLELRLHDLVCRGQLGLHAAQQAIASDWLAAYRRYIGNAAAP